MLVPLMTKLLLLCNVSEYTRIRVVRVYYKQTDNTDLESKSSREIYCSDHVLVSRQRQFGGEQTEADDADSFADSSLQGDDDQTENVQLYAIYLESEKCFRFVSTLQPGQSIQFLCLTVDDFEDAAIAAQASQNFARQLHDGRQLSTSFPPRGPHTGAIICCPDKERYRWLEPLPAPVQLLVHVGLPCDYTFPDCLWLNRREVANIYECAYIAKLSTRLYCRQNVTCGFTSSQMQERIPNARDYRMSKNQELMSSQGVATGADEHCAEKGFNSSDMEVKEILRWIVACKLAARINRKGIENCVACQLGSCRYSGAYFGAAGRDDVYHTCTRFFGESEGVLQSKEYGDTVAEADTWKQVETIFRRFFRLYSVPASITELALDHHSHTWKELTSGRLTLERLQTCVSVSNVHGHSYGLLARCIAIDMDQQD